MHALNLSPEFFYLKKFVTIKISRNINHVLDISAVSTIYHGTHLNEVKEICVAPNTAAFMGREKRWCPGVVYNEYKQTYMAHNSAVTLLKMLMMIQSR